MFKIYRFISDTYIVVEDKETANTASSENLSDKTYLLCFYGFLTIGYFSNAEKQHIERLIQQNFVLHDAVQGGTKVNNQYDHIVSRTLETERLLAKAKSSLILKQICDDKEIVIYVQENYQEFSLEGIALIDLQKIFDMSTYLSNGYMLHDRFYGYHEEGRFAYHIDCLDYANSAAYFYNEGYDYYNDIKKVDTKVDLMRAKFYEVTRIHTEEEIIFRSFREAYINIIFFMESFINSVGFDAYLAGLGKTETNDNQLKGIQSVSKSGFKKYSSLRQRLEDIPRIIDNNLLDVNQDPFKPYLTQEVELRNRYVHSAPEKGRLLLDTEDWKNKCDQMIQSDCYNILNAFWMHCYPDKSFPKVIFNGAWGNSFKGHQGAFMAITR